MQPVNKLDKGRTIARAPTGVSHYGALAATTQASAARSAAAFRSPSPDTSVRSLLLLGVLALVAIGFRLLPLGIAPTAHSALAIGLFMIACWVTQVLDHGIAGILGCFLFWMFRTARFETAFSGFADSTPWFLFGAVCFGLMGSKSGLARRLAYLVMRRIGHSYPRLLLGLIVTNFLLTLIVPSGIARVVIMAAIAIGLIEAFGVDRRSNISRGMFVILVYQTTIFDKMVIAGASSITARGAIERFGRVDVLWSQWFLAYVPCDVLVMIVAWRLVLWMYPPETAALPGGAEFMRGQLSAMGQWSAAEIKSLTLMLAAIALWVTDFIHHIPAPMIGLGIGLVSLMPRIGVLDTDDARKVNYLPIFFVAATVSLSNVLVQTRALDVVTTVLFDWMRPHITGSLWSTTLLYWSAFAYHIVIGNEIAMLSTSLPILMAFAREHAINPLALGMIWTFGAGPKIFMYESAVLVVGYSYGYFSNRDMVKVGAVLSVVTAGILLLLVPLYWPLIGIRW